MEIKREGLHTYKVSSQIDNEYFLSVEYPILQYNRPTTLLPVLLREQDGKTVLLYDISDAKDLQEIAASRNYSEQDCKELLVSLEQLLKQLEEYLLDSAHICFSPDSIYRFGDKNFRWMYCPDKERDLQKEVQKFFAWMLSEIDYGDSVTVRFIYKVYWSVRNRSLSRELIQECLNYENEVEEEKMSVGYETFFADQTEKQENNLWKSSECGMKETGTTEEPKKQLEKKEKIKIWMEVGLLIFTIFVGVITLFCLGINIQQQFVGNYVRYLLICIAVFILALQGVCQIHNKRKSEKNMKWKQEKSFITEKKGEEYLEETVQLDMETSYIQPILRKESTGEIFLIQTFPFFIGNTAGLNQLSIEDRTVSRKHAVIEAGEKMGVYTIQDLNSTNGTWVEHVRLGQTPVLLQNGNLVRFASCEYRFELRKEEHLL